jgi:predicted PurR-regulated permease PerM
MSLARTEFITRAFIALAIALLPVLIWYLFDVILICASALLVSGLLGLGAEPLVRWLRLPPRIALVISTLVIFAVLGGAAYLFGSRMVNELHDVIQRAQSGQGTIANSIQSSDVGREILGHIRNRVDIVGFLPRVFSVSAAFVGGIVIAVVAGIFFAAQPRLYLSGLVQLFPPRLRPEADETVQYVGRALRFWLLGQLIQMLLIGGISTGAVWLIGLPSPLALGLIAGLAEFVPLVGPLVSAIPAILVAATQSPHAVVWTIIAYTLIHQAEGRLITPVIQRYMLVIPPAVILLGIVAIGSLFGPAAIPLASPLAVIVFVLINKLYVSDTLGEKSALSVEISRGR